MARFVCCKCAYLMSLRLQPLLTLFTHYDKEQPIKFCSARNSFAFLTWPASL